MPKHQARTAHSNTNRPGMTASLMSYVQVVAARKGGISSGDLVSTNRDPTARIVREAVLVALSDAGYTAENVACYFPCDKSTIYGAKKRWNANGGRTQLHISVYNEARKAVRSASERQEKPSVFVQPGQPIPFPTIPRCPPGSYMQQVYAEQQRRKEMIRKMEYGE